MTTPVLQPLVRIEQHNIALLFSNYLNSINIGSKVEHQDEGFVIYCESQHFDLAKTEFEQFIKQPDSSRYQQAAWQSAKTDKVSTGHPDLLSSFKQQFLAHAGMVTLTVFTLCWLVFIASILGWGNELFYHLRFYQSLSGETFFTAPWRLLGPALFHFSWLHIVFNTMWWWQLGGNIEKALGKVTLLNLFLLSAIISNLGQFFVSGANFGGLSGVVYALVGFVWWMNWLAPDKGLKIEKPILGILLVWMLLGFVDVLPVNMANIAHLLGLVTGCLFAWLSVYVLQSTK